MAISSIDPATGKTLQTFEETSDAEVEAKLKLAVQTFQAHKKLSFAERAKHMRSAAEILERDKRSFGIREFVNIKTVVVHEAAPIRHPASE